ncbi:hypothetical protein J5N97_020017 [Dioscorea zingiberensis]|uniref:Major facilitator superfamily (MFS) profile domain-containing protein n=1 Tax=Dioscorea zingiberensis TaxID=325984 RepID=A0A9D5CF42_9LILI|nr:hypothetical protein J5N97_020017 [Dioscorea zingiberensis]
MRALNSSTQFLLLFGKRLRTVIACKLCLSVVGLLLILGSIGKERGEEMFVKGLASSNNAKEFQVFCIYDTRSLSKVQSENFKLLQKWMAQGVSHGKMVIRLSYEHKSKLFSQPCDAVDGLHGLSIWKKGFSSGNLGTILMGCVQVPITIIGAILMDKSGRRPLLMVSATGTFIGCFLAAVSFYLKELLR